MAANLYAHFPFCRRKCSYCALYSRAGTTSADRDAYVRRLADGIRALGRGETGRAAAFRTVYFGGGSPAMCDLRLVADALCPLLDAETEFTVELHPLDVTAETLTMLADIGVNRLSMGVQSFDDAVLADMGRGYVLSDAERAFGLVKECFDNAGIDLIVGYPGDGVETGGEAWLSALDRFCSMGMRHCSVYSLILEEKTRLWRRFGPDGTGLPSDDETMDALKRVAGCLRNRGLERYEISNYAVPGYECRHNQAVWRGEDYIGLGDGAFGRIGLRRTSFEDGRHREDVVDSLTDSKERTLFRLRTREGLDARRFPAWGQTLERFVQEGLLSRESDVYRLTERGTEVCDAILAELV